MVEPKLPGAVERYVNLGDCYDHEGLKKVRGELEQAMKGYKGCYARAYRCLRAAAEITADRTALIQTPELEEKIAKRAKGILSRELKREGEQAGRSVQRFLGAVTHKGVLTLYGTAAAQCTRIYELVDRYGLAHPLLARLLSGAVLGGYDVVACPDPMAPERLAHLLVPEAGLAFVTSRSGMEYGQKPFRRVRLDAMAEPEGKARLRFQTRMAALLREEGAAALKDAKASHDKLEAVYNPYVDFDGVRTLAALEAGRLLSWLG